MLLLGPPGAGKSGFCHQMVLNGIVAEKPIIFLTTEQSPSAVRELLKEKGMSEHSAAVISFIDAFARTVGLAHPERPDTLDASCEDLNSISMAITKLQQGIGKSDILLIFDSLTSPYLFNGKEIFRFIRLCLQKFASEGNSVVALMDEGCGKEEDLGAMMSAADGIIRMELKEKSRVINVVKHPRIAPTKIEAPIPWKSTTEIGTFNPRVVRRIWEAQSFSRQAEHALRTESGDFVNMFWMNLALWSSMLWDPKRVPSMIYEFQKDTHSRSQEMLSQAPWRMRLLMKLFMPKSFSEVKDMKKFASYLSKSTAGMGAGIWEYMKESSEKDNHYFNGYESSLCWGLDNIGVRLGFHGLGAVAGMLKAFDKEERDWNMVETKCIGLGNTHCEFKVVPEDTGELKKFLESIDSSAMGKIHDHMIDRLTGYLLYGKALPERPRLGSGIAFTQIFLLTSLPALVNERYRMALRMGGAKVGNEIGDYLMKANLDHDEIIRRVLDFMEYCKVGQTTMGETIRIRENCETFGLESGEPSCFFTTGFLNGLFSAVRNQHVREIKCIAAGDPFCEWEIV